MQARPALALVSAAAVALAARIAPAAADLVPPPATVTAVTSVASSLPTGGAGGAATTLAGTVGTAVTGAAAPAGSAPRLAPSARGGTRVSTLRRAVVARIETLRSRLGLPDLALASRLAAAAQAHAESMARDGYFSHRSRDGTPFWRRVARFYPPEPGSTWRVGEVLFWSALAPSSGDIVHAWMTSAEHRRILLGDWRELGVAIEEVDDAPGVFGHRRVLLAVVDFGIRTP